MYDSKYIPKILIYGVFFHTCAFDSTVNEILRLYSKNIPYEFQHEHANESEYEKKDLFVALVREFLTLSSAKVAK
jgi:hypothetical protein